MDQKGDSIIETVTGTHKYYQFIKKTLQFLVPVSFSILFFYFSGFSFVSPYHSRSSTLVLPVFALDRKYMFLICNGILAFLVQNLKVSSSSFNYSTGTGFAKCDEEGGKQTTEPFQILKEAIVQENVVPIEYANSSLNVAVAVDIQKALQQEVESEGSLKGGEMKTGGFTVESEEYWEEEELEKSRALESTYTSDASVSTEELNKKFEEFIRKMKEEIRIDARRQLITV